MRRRALLVLGSLVTLAACDSTPASPEPFDADLAFSASRGGSTRQVPVSVRQQFQPSTDELRACGSDVFLPAAAAATGQWSHLGRTNSVIRVASCAVSEAGLTFDGTATHVAANGDAIEADYTGTSDFTGNIVIEVTFTGGSGRFANTEGSATFTGLLDPATRSGLYEGGGWMTPPGR